MDETTTSTPRPKGPRTPVRITFLILVWILLAAIVAQVALIGLGLFYNPTFTEVHAGVGFIVAHLFGPIALIVGFFARLGRTLTIVNIVNLLLIVLLPILAGLRDTNGIVAALHPVVAITVFALTLYTAAKVRALVPAPLGTAPRAMPATPG